MIISQKKLVLINFVGCYRLQSSGLTFDVSNCSAASSLLNPSVGMLTFRCIWKLRSNYCPSCSQEKIQKEALTRKQQKNQTKQKQAEDEVKPTELLTRPKEYVVKFTFPDPPPLNPPVLGIYGNLF